MAAGEQYNIGGILRSVKRANGTFAASQKAYNGMMLKSLIEKKMKERMSERGAVGGRAFSPKKGMTNWSYPSEKIEPTTTRKEIAKIAGVGEVKFAGVRF